MDDLISRAAACACIGKMIKEYREKGEDDLADGMILARRYGIKKLPTVDAIPVVRCDKCMYRGSNKVCIMLVGRTQDDFYCKYGERRENA